MRSPAPPFRLYRALARLPLGRYFATRLLAMALVGILVPFVALVVYFLLPGTPTAQAPEVLGVALLATIAGAALTLYALICLVAPIRHAALALDRYRQAGEPPRLPTEYRDDVGRLLAHVQGTIERLEALLRSLQHTAATDDVTGTLNREAARERLEVQLGGHEDPGLHLVMLDLDGFREINDQYGDDVGDSALQAFARELAANTRASDWAARWGGDEFILVLSETAPAAVEQTLTRIRRMLRTHPFELPDGTAVALGFSHGLVRLRPGQDVSEALATADARLDSHKRGEASSAA